MGVMSVMEQKIWNRVAAVAVRDFVTFTRNTEWPVINKEIEQNELYRRVDNRTNCSETL